jgi:hypothetical protein
MKILFICGSLESGKDGVGDYVQQLAAELIGKGHDVVAMAINDKHTSVEHRNEQLSNGISVPVFRLPSIQGSAERYQKAKLYADGFSPDLISFQFVPYSFQDKGLPFNIPSFAKLVGTRYQWHIMFHELWLGFSPGSSFKDRVIGFFQRRIVVSLVRVLKPVLVTTSNPLYRRLLRENGVKCAILPLFSNISIAPADQPFRDRILDELGISPGDRHKWRIAGIFGNIYPDSNLGGAINEQLKIETSQGRKLACIGMGNLNDYGKGEFKRLENTFGDQIKFIHLGIQPSHLISNVLQMLDYGIACTPAEFIFKSGVFATMKLHGLTVIQPHQEQVEENDAETTEYNTYLMDQPSHHWAVSYVAELFLQMLPGSIPVSPRPI